jgi:hypothetical protein
VEVMLASISTAGVVNRVSKMKQGSCNAGRTWKCEHMRLWMMRLEQFKALSRVCCVYNVDQYYECMGFSGAKVAGCLCVCVCVGVVTACTS